MFCSPARSVDGCCCKPVAIPRSSFVHRIGSRTSSCSGTHPVVFRGSFPPQHRGAAEHAAGNSRCADFLWPVVEVVLGERRRCSGFDNRNSILTPASARRRGAHWPCTPHFRLACPIFCAVGRVSIAQLFLSSSSRRRGCGDVGSA